MPDLTPIEKSSNLEAYGYADGVLTLRFRGGATHSYEGVPQELLDEFLKAESAGKFFHAQIRNAFKSRRLDEPKKEDEQS